jgi:hypothetical protein
MSYGGGVVFLFCGDAIVILFLGAFETLAIRYRYRCKYIHLLKKNHRYQYLYTLHNNIKTYVATSSPRFLKKLKKKSSVYLYRACMRANVNINVSYCKYVRLLLLVTF